MKVYYLTEWLEEDEKWRDGDWGQPTYKWGKDDHYREFTDRKEFTDHILEIINNGGVIEKVGVKEK